MNINNPPYNRTTQSPSLGGVRGGPVPLPGRGQGRPSPPPWEGLGEAL